MEEMFLRLLPLLDGAGSIAMLIMLKISWNIYQRIIVIEKELGIHQVQADNMKDRIEGIEDRETAARIARKARD